MEFRPHPLYQCASPDHKVAFRVRATVVREPEERECFRFPFAAFPAIRRRKASERDQPRLLRMDLQPKLRQPLLKISQKPFSVRLMLKSGDEIVGVADNNHVTARDFLSPYLDPQVEDIVQVQISQQR